MLFKFIFLWDEIYNGPSPLETSKNQHFEAGV